MDDPPVEQSNGYGDLCRSYRTHEEVRSHLPVFCPRGAPGQFS